MRGVGLRANASTGQIQVLLNMLRGWSVQDALDAPRFCISPGLPDAPVKGAQDAGNINVEVYFELGISLAVVEELKGKFFSAKVIILSWLARNGSRRSPGHWRTKRNDGPRSSHSKAQNSR